MEAFRMLTTHLSACNGNAHFASKGSPGPMDSFGLSHLPEFKLVPAHRFLDDGRPYDRQRSRAWDVPGHGHGLRVCVKAGFCATVPTPASNG